MDILFTIMFCPETESHEHVLPYLENGFQNRQSIFHHQPQYVYTLLTSKFTHYFIQCSIFKMMVVYIHSQVGFIVLIFKSYV